jgi:hypothetical protein
VGDQRGLAVDRGAGGADPPQRVPRRFGLQFARVAEVRHDRQLPAGGDDLLEEARHLVGVAVGGEALGPVGDRLGADADRAHGRDGQQRHEVVAEPFGGHHHRVAARDQDVVHLGMRVQVGDQAGRIRGGEPQFGIADELRPPEAVGAVRVAGLALAGEVEDRLPVLVLQPRHRGAVLDGHVRPLRGRVRVEPAPDVVHHLAHQGAGRPLQPSLVLVGQHAGLREGQLEDRVVRHGPPVDQVVEDVVVDAEGEHQGNASHGVADVRRQAVPTRDRVDVPRAVRLEPRAFRRGVRHQEAASSRVSHR